ncbi:hypothetical protein ACHAW5_010633 [Stephanodiscus triporus]|uniref:PARP-type domain-containing protein n=1 Tax=Stephanodiscus triporus TaxID=2934178 RepID=A0ABD3NW38_9STRA
MKLSRCLSDLGIADASTFEGCDDIDDEFKVVRKVYLKKVLAEHPDKGGDAVAFRATQAAWEVLRGLYNGGGVRGGSFASYLVAPGARAAKFHDDDREEEEEDEDEDDDDFDDELYAKYANGAGFASYEYYEAAAEEEVPGYRVENARSGRSRCAKCDGHVEMGSVRVGSLDKVAGTYGRWNHLDCWRVPAKVQNGLTNPSDASASLRDLLAMEGILLVGVSAMDDESRSYFARHCANVENWARNGKRKRGVVAIMEQDASEGAAGEVEATSDPGGVSAAGSDFVVPGSFRVLVPGVDGAGADDALVGQSFVITGTFPEAGGGDADAVGVANVKAMIQSFGGSVNTRFSKKSSECETYLVECFDRDASNCNNNRNAHYCFYELLG